MIKVLGVSEEVCNLASNRIKYESSFKDRLEGIYYLKAREDSIIKEYQQKCYLNTDLGLKILFNDEMQVTRIFILDKRFKTKKGIRVG